MTTAAPLGSRLPETPGEISADDILERFMEYVADRGLTLYPAQEDALLETIAGRNVILNTPTGSGKSLIATATIFRALCMGARAIYTCPIKALVSEKFFALCEDLGPDNVGMLTGDASINRDAPVLCCTAEILLSMCMREGHLAPADVVVMDEFHYYADKDRGVAWQVPLLVLSSATFLLMSATLGDTAFFERELTRVTGRQTVTVRSLKRPVPLGFSYSEEPLHETVAELVKFGRHPIYLVNFTQRACAEEAQNLMSADYSSKEEKKALAEAMRGERFESPYGKELQRFLRHGIGLHHAGLLPRYRLLVEQLAQQGLLKIICGTDTLGVGVNIPIRTVLFTKLCKYDGEKTAILTARDFHQIAGRAGRKGFDDEGWVVCQAPAHVIENLRAERKAGDDPAKRRKLVKHAPPDRGYVHWDRATFERLVAAQPEPLVSRFKVTHAMVLAALQRPGRLHDGCRALRRLIRSSHAGPKERRRHGQLTWTMFRSLVDAGIVQRDAETGRFAVRDDLQVDFNLHNTLSLWLLDTLPKLDRESPVHALDVLTLCESVVEDPDAILMRQVDVRKREAMTQMKADGVEYEKRIEELEKITYPKPGADFIYETFNAFAAKHPWVGTENIRPKSIAREMFENYHTFSDYIKEYELQRSEGVLLRYLSEAFKVLSQTVPLAERDEELTEILVFLRALVRDVDSSLLDEWERLRAPDPDTAPVAASPEAPAGPVDVTRNRRGFTAMLRRTLFSLVRAIANGDWVLAARLVDAPADGGPTWTPADLQGAAKNFFDVHPVLMVDREARAPVNTRTLRETDDVWDVLQTLVDGDGDNDWFLDVEVDLARSREAGRPVVVLRRIDDRP